MATKRTEVPTPIPDFPGYGVTRNGRVWSQWKRGAGGLGTVWRVIVGGTDKDGYKKVMLCRSGERFYFQVHVLILLVFHGPCPSGMECRHRNGIHNDNRSSNLLWGTHVDNVADKRKHGTQPYGSEVHNACIVESTARAIKRQLAAGVLPGMIAKTMGLKPHIVHNIKYGAWAHVEI